MAESLGNPRSPETEMVAFEVVTLDRSGVVLSRAAGQARVMTEVLPGGVPLAMSVIAGGTFRMGSLPGESFDDERPRHPVTVQPFFLGRAPVTQAQWQAVMGRLPPCRDVGDALPVDRVDLYDALAFCEQLSTLTGRSYRLPSEAEWEYACRAGTTTPFHCGATVTTTVANYVGLHTFANEPLGTYRHHSNPAGTFPPNPYGLYDMHGNVWEWCADAWHSTYAGAPATGAAWGDGTAALSVLRGGCWHDPPQLCRSAARLKSRPSEPEDYFGFRVALSLFPDGALQPAPRQRLTRWVRRHLDRWRR